MILDNECLRDVLLYIENSDYYILTSDNCLEASPIYLSTICINLPKYNKAEIYYSLLNLSQAGFINLSTHNTSNNLDCAVNSITYSGHEFLNAIKDTANWNKIKIVLSSIRNYSLEAIKAVSSGITSATIETCLNTIISKNV